jgi:hypothetical protein
VFCTFPSATDWFFEGGVAAGALPESEGWAALRIANEVYDYFFNTFHRHSFSGAEEEVRLILDVPLGSSNARYDRTCNHFVFSDMMATRDIIAHEFTHGVTRYSSNLIYAEQPGALNESYSDVFAAMIDTANWTIGEGSAAGTLRSLSDPSALGDPDHKSGYQWLPNTREGDWGGVHTNSGIPNKAAYLIVAGGTHRGVTVRGIGRAKTQQLYYDVLTTRLWSGAWIEDARNQTVALARRYAQEGIHGFTPRDACSVGNAFAAIGYGVADNDCDGNADPYDADDDNDTIPDASDNCALIMNANQYDIDRDGRGDVCDEDDDGDSIPDLSDNCPKLANPDQRDTDGDGVGAGCDWNEDGAVIRWP